MRLEEHDKRPRFLLLTTGAPDLVLSSLAHGGGVGRNGAFVTLESPLPGTVPGHGVGGRRAVVEWMEGMHVHLEGAILVIP